MNLWTVERATREPRARKWHVMRFVVLADTNELAIEKARKDCGYSDDLDSPKWTATAEEGEVVRLSSILR